MYLRQPLPLYLSIVHIKNRCQWRAETLTPNESRLVVQLALTAAANAICSWENETYRVIQQACGVDSHVPSRTDTTFNFQFVRKNEWECIVLSNHDAVNGRKVRWSTVLEDELISHVLQDASEGEIEYAWSEIQESCLTQLKFPAYRATPVMKAFLSSNDPGIYNAFVDGLVREVPAIGRYPNFGSIVLNDVLPWIFKRSCL